MSKRSEYVIRWRIRMKHKFVASMGGCCQICGYKKCVESLDFHHLDTSTKEFSFSKLRSHPRKLEIIKEEMKKCILLCANCHREVHAGMAKIPEVYATFDESFIKSEYELRRNMKKQSSVVTLTEDRRKIFLTDDQLHDMLSSQFNGNKSALARSLNVSETAIRKRLKNVQISQRSL